SEHPVDRFLEELAVFHRLDVVALDAAEHFGEEPEVVHRQHDGSGLAIGHRGEMQARRDAESGAERHETDLLKLFEHAFLVRVVAQGATQASGSKGLPSRRSSKYRPDSASPPVAPTRATGSPPRTLSPTCRS